MEEQHKSAPEMFTADKMSDANREQVTAYISGIWQTICKDVSESRKISVDSLNAYADRLITFDDPKEFVKRKMVDKLIYTDGIKAEINKLMKKDADDNINTAGLAEMKLLTDNSSKGDEIAVYYAYGNIVDSEETGMMSQGHNIVGKKVCEDLQALADDDNVKAVVLRINSGGGSAYASEQIWHYVEMLKKKKPVVVSMGGMAASGGYYISSGANWIVAEPTTLTGSIGIFGMFPDFSGLLTQKLGVKFDEVKTNKNSGLGTPARPFNEEEMAYIENYIDRGYKLFRSRVAEGRKLSVFVVHHNADQLALSDNLGLIHAYADPLTRVNRGLEFSRRVCRLLFIRKAQNNDGMCLRGNHRLGGHACFKLDVIRAEIPEQAAAHAVLTHAVVECLLGNAHAAERTRTVNLAHQCGKLLVHLDGLRLLRLAHLRLFIARQPRRTSS
mgnify:CR=1 FL=1